MSCVSVSIALSAATSSAMADDPPADQRDIFAKENLVAWCIVPFDASKRSPEQRAEMLHRLGLKKVAYDWRKEHVEEFEEEILAYQQHGLEFFAFWDWHPSMAELIKKHEIRPQFWKTNPSPKGETQQEKIAAAVKQLLPLVETARELECQVGLYNHGGWGGEPANLVAVCRRLRDNHDASHVGIVYNFHHAHGQMEGFSEALALMKPYLLCLNINGMNENAKPKILPLGQGAHERRMLQIVLESGYSGPIGILDHRPDVDAEQSLRENLTGLRSLRSQLIQPE